MNASTGGAASVAARKILQVGPEADLRCMRLTAPTQRGRRYLAVEPRSASLVRRPGNSTRSWPGSRGVSPANPEKRLAMYVA